MSRYVFKLPDLGEGTVAAEIVAWRVKVGDAIAEDGALVEMATDKAVVEVPSPASGRVVSLAGKPGDMVSVGAELVVIETGAEVAPAVITAAPKPAANEMPVAAPLPGSEIVAEAMQTDGPRARASPATRRRARETGLDITQVVGSGPGGRVLASDLAVPSSASNGTTAPGVEELPVIGIRRMIAQRMAEAKRNIPHFAYVEEIDVTELENLRLTLNAALPEGSHAYSYLPLIVAALVDVLREFPQCNAHYDAARNVVLRYRALHVGIATQTPDGLKVPVVRDVGSRSLADLAAEIRRVTEAARNNKAKRDELTGSTITLTSLGKMGGIVSTPILNAPEVAIIGINKAVERVVVRNGGIMIRRMMNLSSSFDHRFVDGFNAAAMIQALKAKLENPDSLGLR